MKKNLILFQLLIFCFNSIAFDEGWTKISDPSILSQSFETRFFILPKSGKLESLKHYWSGDYWPLSKGMIDYRWKDLDQKLSKNLENISFKNLSLDQINQLSPIEKLDLLNGDYHFSLKNQIRSEIPSKVEVWEGLCHGWAAATVNHPEPGQKILVNPDGIKIPFDSSDTKALLSYYYATLVSHQGFVGSRCQDRDEDCEKDLNAGAFHIILSNFLGIEHKPLVADLQRYIQVWNHPLLGFESKIISEWSGADRYSAAGTSRRVKIKTKLHYLSETDNDPLPVIGTKLQNEKFIELSYILEIDQYGLIIGGRWISNLRPDFIWVPGRVTKFEKKFYRLNELVDF